jgi:hypothetical protein
LPLERRAQSRLVRKAPCDADGNAVYKVDSLSTVGPFRRRSARPREVYESVLRSAAMVASPGRARREARPLRAAQGYARSSSLASRSPHWRRSPTARRRRATAGSRPPAPTKRLRSSGSRLPLRFVLHASRAAELTRCRTFSWLSTDCSNALYASNLAITHGFSDPNVIDVSALGPYPGSTFLKAGKYTDVAVDAEGTARTLIVSPDNSTQ